MGSRGQGKKVKQRMLGRPPVVRATVHTYTEAGGLISSIKPIRPTAAKKKRDQAEKELQQEHANITAQACQTLNEIRDVPQEEIDWQDEPMGVEDLDDLLAGRAEALPLSGAGGKFRDTLEAGLRAERLPKGKRAKDLRKRRDHIAKQVSLFAGQMKAIGDAYMQWGVEVRDNLYEDRAPFPEDKIAKHMPPVTVVDVFRTYTACIPIRKGDVFTAASFFARGLVPCASHRPKVVFSIRLLDLFRVMHLRTPQVSIQSWVKAIANLHGVPFKPYQAQQFWVAYDLYLATLKESKQRVDMVLGQDGPRWRRENCCPACMNKLEGEAHLKHSMLITMDGNDSLKCVLRKEPADFDDEGNPLPGVSRERFDPRAVDAGGDYFLPREQVNRWEKDRLKDMGRAKPADVGRAKPADEKTQCEERWKNLADDSFKKMWAIYDETGIFMSLCRHGFVLAVADMVRSGELSKYALAIEEDTLDCYGHDVVIGFDTACGNAKTLWNSPLGPRALLQNLILIVGAFYGHAHNRLCQLLFLISYIEGMGLEDLEGCERFFSKSNANAGSVRYASIFHRLQTLTNYFAHVDTHNTYANLSKFLVDNYWQALGILDTEPALRAKIDSVDVFPARLQEELKFLKSLMGEAEEDTLHMEYYQRLVNFADRTLKRDLARQPGSPVTARRHAEENWDKAFADVQQSEAALGVVDRWEPTGPQWAEAAHLVSTKRYRMALLKLERLVIQRMFELTKMNLSQTGYKLRKHIAKALQARSQAIRTALKTYNTAAASLAPPGRALSWSEVVAYAFLADFDLLRDPEKIGEIERAKEEIIRCNIEIRRLVTYIRDEQAFLLDAEKRLKGRDPGLAWSVRRYRWARERYNEAHMKRLRTFAKKAGHRFTGTLEPGVAVKKPPGPNDLTMEDIDGREGEELNRELSARMEEDDVGEQAEGEQLAEEIFTVYMVAEE
ncbi:hypothetical protein B0H16DRAFT_1463071 [Mycena metata]|uniref:CxC1-like cysteine cluster associated with KDZ transposases domain-containing protein n=1 Tax=Mycena metata TaxID=1033252 RepID=A0AAD7IMV4_9AGAR|nr:hypothetical protein B0H16DRAFT_1463071 [Mycena metata]